MSDAHQIVFIVAVGLTVALLGSAVWSVAAGRGSGGARDHRFAVDRLILLVAGAVAMNGLLGVALLAGGSRPADPLHLLYGPVGLATPVVGWWIGGRRPAGAEGSAHRARRDAWLVVASIVLLGIELRLMATG